MAGFTKLFNSIITSTIWREDDKTRIVWITMLALSDADGLVEASIPGLADAARVTIEECEKALGKLSSPDEYSRTQDHEGRRIEKVDGGWQLLNYLKYRQKSTPEAKKEYWRKKKAEYRAKNKDVQRNVQDVQDVLNCPPMSIQAEGEAEAEAEAEEEAEGGKNPPKKRLTPEEVSALKLKEKTFGKVCTYCGKSPFDNYTGKPKAMRWFANLPFCAEACYKSWKLKLGGKNV